MFTSNNKKEAIPVKYESERKFIPSLPPKAFFFITCHCTQPVPVCTISLPLCGTEQLAVSSGPQTWCMAMKNLCAPFGLDRVVQDV